MIESLFVIAAACAAFLLGLVLGWLGTSAAAALSIERWSPSRTPEEVTGIERKVTFALSQLDYADALQPKADSIVGLSSGFLNSNNAACRTSTFSAIANILTSGSPERGTTAWDPVTNDIYELVPGSKNFGAIAPEQFPTPESTPARRIKRNCRICSKIRALVDFGGS